MELQKNSSIERKSLLQKSKMGLPVSYSSIQHLVNKYPVIHEQPEKPLMRVLVAVPTFESVRSTCIQSIYGMKKPANVEVVIEFIVGYGVTLARNKAAT